MWNSILRNRHCFKRISPGIHLPLFFSSHQIFSLLDINYVFNYAKIFSPESKFSSAYWLLFLFANSCTSRRLPCSFITYALLGSYTAQAELGDYCESEHGTSIAYLKDLQFAPEQDEELLKRIHEQHQRHKYALRSIRNLFFERDAGFSKGTTAECCWPTLSGKCKEISHVRGRSSFSTGRAKERDVLWGELGRISFRIRKTWKSILACPRMEF